MHLTNLLVARSLLLFTLMPCIAGAGVDREAWLQANQPVTEVLPSDFLASQIPIYTSALQEVVFVVVAYKALSVLAGLLSIVLGYRLFQSGVYEKAGELKAAWGDSHLALKQSAPGTFFSLFGAAIIAFSVVKGISIESIANSLSDVNALHSSRNVPPQVISSIERMTNGEELSPEEKERVESWLQTEMESIEIKIQAHAKGADLG